jgi:class 3 adenylate cyclase
VRLSDLTGTLPAYRPGQRLLAWMQQHKRPLRLGDPVGDTRFDETSPVEAVRSVLCAPLLVRGRLIGVLTLYNKKAASGFTEEDERLLGIIAAQSAQVVQNTRLNAERSRILTIFGQHTAPAVVEALLREGAGLASERRHVCVMFLDIRGFTAFAEQHAPEQVVDYLSRLFEVMIDQVNRHHGIVHQLLGDGFMALFGAPVSYGNDCQHALDASLAMLRRVRAMGRSEAIPPTRLGIGLHAGEVVAGLVGSPIHREYKVTGDVVNLAARIEQMNKPLGTQLLVSEAVWQAADRRRLPARALGAVDVPGRAEPITLYQLA